MDNLREVLESLTLLCWNATEQDELEQKVQEYLKTYPHLRNPATIDVLYETVKMWLRVQELERLLTQCSDPVEARKLMNSIKQMTMAWLTMLGNLGITFTRQQYKSKRRTVQPPMERLKMLQKPEEKEENGKT